MRLVCVDEVIWSKTSIPSAVCVAVTGNLWAFLMNKTQKSAQKGEFWHFLCQKLGMAF